MTTAIIIASVSAIAAIAAIIAEIRNRRILKAEAKAAAETTREITSQEIWDAVAEKRAIIRTLDRAAAKKW